MSFFSDSILNKQGPLGKVWLASHLERKLSKAALLQTNIPKSVLAILGTGDEVVPVMALRLSGQLLLGVSRIYSRKAKYLMDDCSEVSVKINLAYRPVHAGGALTGAGAGGGGAAGAGGAARRGGRGDVDMTEEEAARVNINLQLGGDMRGVNDFDVLYNAEFGGFGIWDDFQMNPLAAAQNARKEKQGRATIANQADITLREDHALDDYDRTIDLNFGDEMGFGSQEYRALSADPEDGVTVNGDDFELGLDLDLELDLGLMDDDENGNGTANDRQRRSESPAAFAARQQRDCSAGPSKVAAIAAEARALSEAPSEGLSDVPSVEIGRDAATPGSLRDVVPPSALPEAGQGLDDSIFKEGHARDDHTFDLDLGGGPDDTTFDLGGANDVFDDTLPQDEIVNGQATPRATSPAAEEAGRTEGTPQRTDAATDADARAGNEPPIDMTPNTAARVADVAAIASAQRKRKEAAEGAAARPKSAKIRKQIVDSVTELAERGRGLGGLLADGSQSQNSLGGASLASKEERQAQGLIKDAKYLPATTIEMRFQEIYDQPGKYFFSGLNAFASGGKATVGETFYAGPPGMPPALQSLFEFRLGEKGKILGAKRVPGINVEDTDEVQRAGEERRKRARTSVVPDVELGRDRQPSLDLGDGQDLFDMNRALDTFDDDGQPDFGADAANDFSLDLDDFSTGGAGAASFFDKTPSRIGSAHPLSSSPGPLDASLRLDLDGIDRVNTSILAVFDETPASKDKTTNLLSTPSGTNGRGGRNLSVPGTRHSQLSAEQSLLEESVHSASQAASRGKTGGWSRNTVKALKILEHELGPAPTESGPSRAAEEKKQVSFEDLSHKASRRAAASMFFEMLILGTRDCVKLEQPAAYGDIAISSKNKLWEVCEGLNNLSVEADSQERRQQEGEGEDGQSRAASPLDDAEQTPTRKSKSKSHRMRDSSTPLVSSSARSRRTVDMTM